MSLADKRNILSLVKLLKEFNIETIATEQTARLLDEHLNTTKVSQVTGFPEILAGRVKTLHPKIHGAILARKGDKQDMRDLKQQQVDLIDLVVVNLYDFAGCVQKGRLQAEIIERIDVGGSALIRAAAKNYRNIALISSPDDYEQLAQEMHANDGCIGEEFRLLRAARAFALSAAYDRRISDYFWAQTHIEGEREEFIQGSPVYSLRYGENPHQEAVLYANADPPQGLAGAQCLQGKPLSYNNLVDADIAGRIVRQFAKPSCAIVKHAIPCGVAQQEELITAYQKAFAADSESAFGGVIAFNRQLDSETAARILGKRFAEVIIAPEFSAAARKILSVKKNLRLLVYAAQEQPPKSTKFIDGGFLIQDTNRISVDSVQWVTRRQAPEHYEDLLFAWDVVKLCHSNAIVIARQGITCGIGNGQTSRVFSVRCALLRAKDNGVSLDGAVLASDAFFPFADSIELLAETNIAAIIQPGGSKRDAEVIAAADAQGIAMAFTGQRAFFHG